MSCAQQHSVTDSWQLVAREFQCLLFPTFLDILGVPLQLSSVSQVLAFVAGLEFALPLVLLGMPPCRHVRAEHVASAQICIDYAALLFGLPLPTLLASGLCRCDAGIQDSS